MVCTLTMNNKYLPHGVSGRETDFRARASCPLLSAPFTSGPLLVAAADCVIGAQLAS